MGSLGSTRVRVLAGAVAVGAIVVALFAVVWRTTTERLVGRMFRILPERLRPAAERIAHTFLDGFASLKTPRLALLVGAGSLAMWMVINIQIYCIMRAFGLELPLSAAFVVTTAAVLGLFVPTPGGVGGYHAAVQFALTRRLPGSDRDRHRGRAHRPRRVVRSDLDHRIRRSSPRARRAGRGSPSLVETRALRRLLG